MDCCKKDEEKVKVQEDPKTEIKDDKFNLMFFGVAVIMLGLLLFNQLAINNLAGDLQVLKLSAAPVVQSATQSTSQPSQSASAFQQVSLDTQKLWNEIAPRGVPVVYGNALKVSYDDPEAAIPILYQFDDYYGSQPITLTGEKMKRYISITTAISCEYCCGAKAITTSTGQAACGCAHSAAMRGLAKYLLDKNPELSDEEILAELGKWKVLFFPDNSVKKAVALQASNLPTDYISLSSNKYRGIENSVGRSTAGGLPSQVGGC